MSLEPLFLTAASNMLSQIINHAITNRWKRLDKEKVEEIIKDYLKAHSLVGQTSAIEREIILVLTNGGVIDPKMNQHWRVVPIDSAGEVFKILSAQSGKSLDVPKNMTDNRVQIQQWSYGGGTNQQWRLIRVK